MDVAVLGVMVPIVAIVMGVGATMLRTWTRHQQEVERIRATRGQTDATTSSEVEQLRRELMQLRDTTTQYDMSVEHAIEEIRRRLEAVESAPVARARPASPSAPHSDETVAQTLRTSG